MNQTYAFDVECLKSILLKLETYPESIEKLIEVFPFEKLTTYNVINTTELNLLTTLLNYFVVHDGFYANPNVISVTIDFALTNVTFLAKQSSNSETLLPLLIFLERILNRLGQQFRCFENLVDDDRIFETVLVLMTSPHQSIADKIRGNRVLCECLQLRRSKVKLPQATNVVNETLNHLVRLEKFSDVCLLANLGLRYRLLTCESEAISWIFSNFSVYLNENATLEDIRQFLECIWSVYKVDEKLKVSKHLFGVANKLILYCCHQFLKDVAQSILAQMVLDFTACNNVKWSHDYSTLLLVLDEFPNDLEKWCLLDKDEFFVVAHLLAVYESPRWTSHQILAAIAKRLSTPSLISHPVLKAMCYLYPINLRNVTPDRLDQKFVGEKLMRNIRCSGAIDLILSRHEMQLAWILRSGELQLQMKTLASWLEDYNDDDGSIEMELANVVKQCKAQKVLLELVVSYPDRNVCRRATCVLHDIKNQKTARQIRVSLFYHFHQIQTFGDLILSGPGIPSNCSKRLQLCRLMGAILPSLNDADVFKGACEYSTNLLICSQQQPKAMIEFCTNISNVKVLLDAARNDDDSLALKAIRLLTNLLKFQMQHHLQFENGLKEDLTPILHYGHKERLGPSLQMFELILTYRRRCKLYIDYKHETSLSLYQKLLGLGRTELEDAVHRCLSIFLKKSTPHLAYAQTTCVYVEMQCEFAGTRTYSREFLLFLELWLQRIKESEHSTVSGEVVERFFRHVPGNFLKDK